MTAGAILRSLAVAGMVMSVPQQQPNYHKPMAPIGPTSSQQCRALEAEWSTLCKRISDDHQACLDGYKGSDVKGAGECSRGPCLPLHTQMTTCGGKERESAVSGCYTSARAYEEREAAARRAEEEFRRAAEAAERARLAKLAADVDRSRAAAADAQRLAEDYKRKAAGYNRDAPPLRPEQVDALEDLVRRADAAAAAAGVNRALDATADTTAALIDLGRSARELLMNEGYAALMEGLGHSERFGFIAEFHELGSSVIDNVENVMNTIAFIRDRPDGTGPPDWGRALTAFEGLSGWAGTIPALRFPAGSQIAGVAGGLREAHELAWSRIDAMMTGRASDAGNLERDMIEALARRLMPWDSIQRINRFTVDLQNTGRSIYDLWK